jgi:hypothetical protein
MLKPIIRKGQIVERPPTVDQTRRYVLEQLKKFEL